MKSFRLYRPPPPPTPKRPVADYKPAELQQLKESFRPAAKGYRLRRRIVLLGLCGFAGGLLLALLLPRRLMPTSVAIALICWLVMFAAIGTEERPECPACTGFVFELRHYCPECGGLLIPKKQSWEQTQCACCNKILRGGKPRTYRIRACTHCGVVLDDRGL
jgi:hypothetical protein